MAEALTRRARASTAIVALALGLAAAALAEPGAAQTKPKAPAPKAKTTLDGIYTAAQAAQGEDLYYGTCVNCHPKGTYAGPTFKTNWNGRPLSDLFDWVQDKMPKNDPGTLTPAQSAQVVAYILQQNKMPAGKAALPATSAALEPIRIEIK
jgi:mono/diheme cytochrome c family protein